MTMHLIPVQIRSAATKPLHDQCCFQIAFLAEVSLKTWCHGVTQITATIVFHGKYMYIVLHTYIYIHYIYIYTMYTYIYILS